LDVFYLSVFLNGSFSEVRARFMPMDADTPTLLLSVHSVQNMSLIDTYLIAKSGVEAYVKAEATISPASLGISHIEWIFNDYENNKDHKLQMSFEVTYFNGTAYQRIIVPAILEVLIRDV